MELAGSISSEPSEREVIQQVVRGARDEFRHLVHAHQEQVYLMILKSVGDEQLARELTQDTFLKAYLNLSKFRFQSSFSTWLIRIALNSTNSYFSSKRFKQKMRTTSFDGEIHRKDSPEQDDGFDEEAIERLRLAIGRLKPIYRDVLTLCALEKKSYEDAAALLDVPIGTIRSRLNKARHLLRKMYFKV